MAIASQDIHVLHVTPWFPGKENPSEALFIARHIQSLEPFCTQTVLHISLSMEKRKSSRVETPGYVLIERYVPFNSWRLYEWIFYRILQKELKKWNARTTFTHVNFHIAYPAMVYYQKLRNWLPKHKLITEHWSAYHFNFSAKKKPERLRKIFSYGVPVLAVSNSLANDIKTFSGVNPKIDVLPNVVDISNFKFHNQEIADHYFAVALWKYPKRPLEILEMVLQRKKIGKPIKLRMAGYGHYEKQIIHFIDQNGLTKEVSWMGQLNPQQIANELNVAKALLLATGYETFSTIIAEAFCCGCPVVANNVGAIKDHLTPLTGVAVEEDWMSAMNQFENRSFDRAAIAQAAQYKFNMTFIGTEYFKLLSKQV